MIPGKAQIKSLGSMPQVIATGHQMILVRSRTALWGRKDSDHHNSPKQMRVKRRLRQKAMATRLRTAIKTPVEFVGLSFVIRQPLSVRGKSPPAQSSGHESRRIGGRARALIGRGALRL
jgi:hypothetical protein